MMQRLIIMFLLLNLVGVSCSVNENDEKGFIKNFAKNEREFSELVTLVNSKVRIKSYVGHSLTLNELSTELRERLNRLGVTRIDVSQTECEEALQLDFVTDWASSVVVYFTKDPCDKLQTQKGYYKKVSTMIEVWGLGNGWCMWIDSDFI